MIAYASVCDGIGAAHVAWSRLGWRCAWTSEIDPFCCAVVEQRWGLPNLGDMTTIDTEAAQREHGPIDLLVGGTPCQSFSVAGLRRGMADPRGNLALVFLGLADRFRPRWLEWENVPGVLSSSGGRDFGSFLGALAELGYGFCYRVLDAQYIRVQSHHRAVPQRRRRVFVIGYFGDWRPAASVLLERQSLCGHPPPSREAGKGAAGTLEARTDGGGFPGSDGAMSGHVIAQPCVVQPVSHTLRAEGFDASEDGTGRGTPLVPQLYPVANCMTSRMHKGINTTCDEGQTPVVQAAQASMLVRRLTPRECERLQGFPDDYTAITYRGKTATDTPRYKALGNSMAVNVMSWIGQRIINAETPAPTSGLDHTQTAEGTQ